MNKRFNNETNNTLVQNFEFFSQMTLTPQMSYDLTSASQA